MTVLAGRFACSPANTTCCPALKGLQQPLSMTVLARRFKGALRALHVLARGSLSANNDDDLASKWLPQSPEDSPGAHGRVEFAPVSQSQLPAKIPR
jgi:hypothetical protein